MNKEINKNVQIVSVEGKDVLTKNYKITDKTLRIGSLDYSMETDKLRTLGKNVIKFDNKKERYYTYSIINVTFKYACKEDKDLTITSTESIGSIWDDINGGLIEITSLDEALKSYEPYKQKELTKKLTK